MAYWGCFLISQEATNMWVSPRNLKIEREKNGEVEVKGQRKKGHLNGEANGCQKKEVFAWEALVGG
jgi:hypothetical protein